MGRHAFRELSQGAPRTLLPWPPTPHLLQQRMRSLMAVPECVISTATSRETEKGNKGAKRCASAKEEDAAPPCTGRSQLGQPNNDPPFTLPGPLLCTLNPQQSYPLHLKSLSH